MKKVLSIAGSDSSGGAGIQADIKTITSFGMFAMTAITALTAQNTTGVSAVSEASPEMVAAQIDAVFDDIPPDSVKIGMVASISLIETIAERLTSRGASNIVVDPVMIATSGAKLISDDARGALIERLLPLGTLITPNLPEASSLSGIEILDENDMERAARIIADMCGAAVLVKGGHAAHGASDLLWMDERAVWFRGERIETRNTHGTGCTLSSAAACGLAAGKNIEQSVLEAKEYVSGALASMLDLGRGCGPIDHMWRIRS